MALAELRRYYPELPIYDLSTGSEQVAGLLAEQRVVARLALILGGMGLFLAAIGLYGVLAYAVTERTREIGIRTALGAAPPNVVGIVMRRGLLLATLGIALALPGAWGLGRLIESRLFGVSPLDGITYGVGVASMIAVSCWRTGSPRCGRPGCRHWRRFESTRRARRRSQHVVPPLRARILLVTSASTLKPLNLSGRRSITNSTTG